ncbi:MAG: hypothetical protein J5764_00310, partial [Bacteroidales bacterium]|nr:hypothetical protein [Bacteroidales bacterium]
MERQLKVKKVAVPAGTAAFAVPAILDTHEVSFHAIDCVNWPEEYPYKPEVEFRCAHNGSELFLEFRVNERAAMAVTGEDQGPVWEDSCVEFFAAFPGQDAEPAKREYYNFECNCIGKLLLKHGISGERSNAPESVIKAVRRWTSLGSEPFAERGPVHWNLVEIIPIEAFYKDQPQKFDGLEMYANFYKCGDKLSVPHFLSWAPIDFPRPNFHLSAFFGKLIFGCAALLALLTGCSKNPENLIETYPNRQINGQALSDWSFSRDGQSWEEVTTPHSYNA